MGRRPSRPAQATSAACLALLALLGCSDTGDDAAVPEVPSESSVVVDDDAGGVFDPAGGDVFEDEQPDRPPSESELDPPPPPDLLCTGDAMGAVATAIGQDVATVITTTDPSGRTLCSFGDADEVALVRVRFTDEASDVTPADQFAARASEPGAEPEGDGTITWPRGAGGLGAMLVEVTVLDTIALDDAAATQAATIVLSHFLPG